MTKPAKVINLERAGESDTMSLNQAAAFIGISKTQLIRAIHGRFDGKPFPHIRIGRRIITRKTWVLQWLEDSRHDR